MDVGFFVEPEVKSALQLGNRPARHAAGRTVMAIHQVRSNRCTWDRFVRPTARELDAASCRPRLPINRSIVAPPSFPARGNLCGIVIRLESLRLACCDLLERQESLSNTTGQPSSPDRKPLVISGPSSGPETRFEQPCPGKCAGARRPVRKSIGR